MSLGNTVKCIDCNNIGKPREHTCSCEFCSVDYQCNNCGYTELIKP